MLWAGGISFAGVLAFIYADLITLPILLIYRKYLVFAALGLVPDTRPSIESITERGITLNYTAALNVIFTLAGASLVWLTVSRGYTDPVCGMRVDRYQTRHTARWRDQTVYFCSAGCQQAFEADPEHYADSLERTRPWRGARFVGARRS